MIGFTKNVKLTFYFTKYVKVDGLYFTVFVDVKDKTLVFDLNSTF
jgi:hypothetical protein